MTATTFGTARPAAADERPVKLAPAEGWLAVGLVLLLCLTLAWSIDDAAWVIGPRGLTDFLPWAIGLGVGWGVLSAKIGWSRWLAHLLGAVFGVLIVSMIVGSRLPGAEGGPVGWFQATAAASSTPGSTWPFGISSSLPRSGTSCSSWACSRGGPGSTPAMSRSTIGVRSMP